jgi:hypothetical protein
VQTLKSSLITAITKAEKMSSSAAAPQRSYRADEWGAVSFAFLLIVMGVFWLIYPTIWSEIGRFLSDLKPVEFNGVPIFVEPRGDFTFLYGVAAEFFIVLSLWLFGLTVIRLYRHSYPRLVSRTVTRAVFLLGLGFFSWQLQLGGLAFRSLVPLVIVLFGASLIIQGLWDIFIMK